MKKHKKKIPPAKLSSQFEGKLYRQIRKNMLVKHVFDMTFGAIIKVFAVLIQLLFKPSKKSVEGEEHGEHK